MSVVFDRAVEFYDETRGFAPGQAAPIAALIARVAGIQPESRVLEIGIGTGRIALPLAPHVHSITGVDLSRGMLDRLCARRNGEAVYVAQADISRLPFPAHRFDALVAVHIFHLVDRWEEALREAARVLRPGARLVHGNGGIVRPAGLYDAFNRSESRPPNIGVPQERRETFLEESGWRPIGERQTHHYTASVSLRTFYGQAERRVWSSTWRMSDEALQRKLADLRTEIEEHHGGLDTVLDVPGEFTVRAYLPPLG
ncbi:MAG: class I SAM-dependent methyltransferase [Anaerolineae bacterium]|nr:class I SAM-dependent methyltransferase [Anaerolineae bacterium]